MQTRLESLSARATQSVTKESWLYSHCPRPPLVIITVGVMFILQVSQENLVNYDH